MDFYILGGVLLVVAVAGTLAAVVRARYADREGARRRYLRRPDLLVVSIGLVLALTLTPNPGSTNRFLPRPLAEISLAFSHPWQSDNALSAIGNVLLFAPFGAVVWMRAWSRRRAVLAGCGLSIAVELTQLAIPGRWTATDDLILNTLGTLVGWQAGAVVLHWIAGGGPASSRGRCSASRAGRP